MNNIFAVLCGNAFRCCLTTAVLLCAVPCAAAHASVYEVSATGKTPRPQKATPA